MKNEPLVSCLCVSSYRAWALKNSINYFLNQSYSNKELVIIHADQDAETTALIKKINSPNISSFPIKSYESQKLGELRNISIEKANGEYICNWDDDDWYHQDRIKIQMEPVLKLGKQASILMYCLLYDMVNDNAYLSFVNTWQPSILCSTSVLEKHKIKYAPLSISEDVPFIDEIVARNLAFPIIYPHSYIYIYTGKNTSSTSHFESFFKRSQKLLPEYSNKIGMIVRGECSYIESSKILTESGMLGSFKYFDPNLTN